MAFISKEQVQQKNIKLKEICKKYNIKAKFSGSNSSTLVCKITEGVIDFFSNAEDCEKVKNNSSDYVLNAIRVCKSYGYLPVNVYYINESFSGIAVECLQEIYSLMLEGHWDDSDIQTDYFSCSWYNRICIGGNKPYKLV